jgi:hypothetical protein
MFAQKYATSLAANGNIAAILANAPQLVTTPVFFSTNNVRPYDIPVATAVTFVGLIYLTIIAVRLFVNHSRRGN